MIELPKCRVSCTDNYPNHTLEQLTSPKISAPEEIAAIWARMKGSFISEVPNNPDLSDLEILFQLKGKDIPENRAQIVSYLSRLCIEETDAKAHASIIPMIEKALHKDVEITPSDNPEHSGIFFLSLHGERFAIFKMGEKRARYETLNRAVLHQLGLEDRFIPVVPCTIEHPRFPEEESSVSADESVSGSDGDDAKVEEEEAVHVTSSNLNLTLDEPEEEYYHETEKFELTSDLFNSNQKEFIDPNMSVTNAFLDGKKCTLTGVLVPFVKFGKAKTVEDFAELVVGCLVAGVRDVTDDALADYCVLVDHEDAFPNRLDPKRSPQKCISATHLPILDDPVAKMQIPQEKIIELREKVYRAGIFGANIAPFLERQTVRFADPASEALEPADEELYDYPEKMKLAVGIDHGHFDVKSMLIPPAKRNKLYTSLKLDAKNPRGTQILTFDQRRATAQRIDRLQRCLAQNTPLTPEKISDSVDIHAGAHYKELESGRFSRTSKRSAVGSVDPDTTSTFGDSTSSNPELRKEYWNGVQETINASPQNIEASPRLPIFSQPRAPSSAVSISPYFERRLSRLSGDSDLQLFAGISNPPTPSALGFSPFALDSEEKKTKNG